MKLFYFIFILFSLKLKKYLLFSTKEFIKNPMIYSNELCSYHGIPYYNSTSNEVTCKCREKYTDEPRKDKIKYINGHIIHCSYERKSRFYTIFLCVCIPIGLDFLYLKRYIPFFASLCISLSVFTSNIIVFYINYKINLKSKETMFQNKLNKLTNNVKNIKQTEDKYNKCRKIFGIINKFFLFNHVIYMTIVLLLHYFGAVSDSEGLNTENDLGYLFLTPD